MIRHALLLLITLVFCVVGRLAYARDTGDGVDQA